MVKLATQLKLLIPGVCVGSTLLVTSQPSSAAALWTDWTSATFGQEGSASGTIAVSDTETIGVTYSGEVFTASQFAGGINYWNPSAPFQSSAVPAPPSTNDIITLIGGTTSVNTITFSKPVVNPVMTILSLGRPGGAVEYQFNQAFDVLSFGAGYWSASLGLSAGSFTELPNNVLEGIEGDGAIQFLGTFTSISWLVPNPETLGGWNGFTIGIQGVAPPPPPPIDPSPTPPPIDPSPTPPPVDPSPTPPPVDPSPTPPPVDPSPTPPPIDPSPTPPPVDPSPTPPPIDPSPTPPPIDPSPPPPPVDPSPTPPPIDPSPTPPPVDPSPTPPPIDPSPTPPPVDPSPTPPPVDPSPTPPPVDPSPTPPPIDPSPTPPPPPPPPVDPSPTPPPVDPPVDPPVEPPVSVPEPHTVLGLLAVGLGSLLARKGKRTNRR